MKDMNKIVAILSNQLSELKIEELKLYYKTTLEEVKEDVKYFKTNQDDLSIQEKKERLLQISEKLLSLVDSSDLAKEYPEAVSSLLVSVLSLVGVSHPIVHSISFTLSLIPKNITGKVVEWSGLLTPEHLIHKGIKEINNKNELVVVAN